MNQGTYIFAQILEQFPRHKFNACVARYKGERYTKNFTCRDQFLAMAFGQLSYRESLRDTVACLTAHQSKLYHLGFSHSVTRSTLAQSNEKRDWRIYRDLAEVLIGEAQKLYVNEPDIADDLNSACYAIDSSSFDPCLSVFHWAQFKRINGAVKLHMVLDLRGSIPTFFDMTNGKVNDMNFLDDVNFELGAFYVMDRGYLDFRRLYSIHRTGAFFVTRMKNNTQFKRRYSRTVDKTTGVMCDQVVYLTGQNTPQKYPETLRRIKYRDAETNHVYVFVTNNMVVSASSIALLYKHRWKVELFFRCIKQHLKIKTFWGYSENAVKTQICIALCVYLFVSILKKRLRIERNIYEILQILSVSLFDKNVLNELFIQCELQKDVKSSGDTGLLFDF